MRHVSRIFNLFGICVSLRNFGAVLGLISLLIKPKLGGIVGLLTYRVIEMINGYVALTISTPRAALLALYYRRNFCYLSYFHILFNFGFFSEQCVFLENAMRL